MLIKTFVIEDPKDSFFWIAGVLLNGEVEETVLVSENDFDTEQAASDDILKNIENLNQILNTGINKDENEILAYKVYELFDKDGMADFHKKMMNPKSCGTFLNLSDNIH